MNKNRANRAKNNRDHVTKTTWHAAVSGCKGAERIPFMLQGGSMHDNSQMHMATATMENEQNQQRREKTRCGETIYNRWRHCPAISIAQREIHEGRGREQCTSFIQYMHTIMQLNIKLWSKDTKSSWKAMYTKGYVVWMGMILNYYITKSQNRFVLESMSMNNWVWCTRKNIWRCISANYVPF